MSDNNLLRYYCSACGHGNKLNHDIPLAPKLNQVQITCENCGDITHVLHTRCPHCKGAFQYYQSDLDFTTEITSLANAYVNLIQGIKDSLSEHIAEFKVPVPKRWSIKLDCTCGKEYTAEIPLPQLN